ncbi:hypothetical protein [Stenotrophomonas virus Jojan60]|jgi:hypothetical protein|nr:hypothetical protein [Stenotrophomonas virus Jojan60]
MSDEGDKAVVVRIGMLSNVTVNETRDTGYSPEEWAELSDKEQNQIIEETVWDILDVWTEEVPC